MKKIVAALAASLAFGITSTAEAHHQTSTGTLRTLAHAVAHARTDTWRCQNSLGIPRTRASVAVWALPASIPYRVWVVRQWDAKKASCDRAAVKRTIPATNDWLTAVNLVQRIYPGTKEWLLFISHREGGWGGFVMNRQGSGCGGWLQYAASTFNSYNDSAYYDARSRGFVIDEATNAWTHPMGQALTGAYMRFTGRDGHHWDL